MQQRAKVHVKSLCQRHQCGECKVHLSLLDPLYLAVFQSGSGSQLADTIAFFSSQPGKMDGKPGEYFFLVRHSVTRSIQRIYFLTYDYISVLFYPYICSAMARPKKYNKPYVVSKEALHLILYGLLLKQVNKAR